MPAFLSSKPGQTIFFLFFLSFFLFPVPVSWAMDDPDMMLEKATDLKARGYYGKAVLVLEKVLDLQKNRLVDRERANILDQLGELYYLAGQYGQAKPVLEKALSIRLEALGPDHLETARSLLHLGVFCTLMGKYEDADKYLGDALKIRKKAFGEEDPAVAEILLEMARLNLFRGDYEKAEPILETVLSVQENTLGPNHPDLIKTLNSMAWMHLDTNLSEKAEPYLNRALKIGEDAFGPEHPFVADTLNYLGRLFYSLKQYDNSTSMGKRALAIREKFLGPNHPDTGLSLNDLALPYYGLEDYEKAKSLFQQSLEIREKALGREHPALLVMLKNLGWTFHVLEDYAGAVPYFERSLAMSEKKYGPEHLKVALAQMDQGERYYDLDEYAKAENLLKRSLATHTKLLEPNHPRIANNLTLLAVCYQSSGRFSMALPLYQQSIKICEKNFDQRPVSLANNLINLAKLHTDLGEFDKAEPLFRRALEILENHPGPEHTSLGTLLNNMAQFYNNLGFNKKAESFYIRSLDIFEKDFGPDHPNVGAVLDNLGMLYHSIEAYDKAEPFHRRALKIQEKALGPEHPNVCRTLNNLGSLYIDQQKYDEAESLYQKVLRIKEKSIGTETDSYANSLMNLAVLFKRKGAYGKSRPLCERAIEIWEKTLGPDHPNVVKGWGHLSDIHGGMGELEKALDTRMRSMEIEDKLIDQVMGFTSEEQKLKYMAQNISSVYCFLGMVNRHFRQEPTRKKQALNAWLKRKGMILEVQKQYQEAILQTDAPEAKQLFEKLGEVRAELSRFTFARLDNAEARQKQLETLTDEKEQLEAKLSRISRPFALSQKTAKVDWEQVAEKLPGGSDLLEFARIPTISDDGKEMLLDRYIVFVLHADDGGVGMIDLGDAERIDRMGYQYRKEITEPGKGGEKTGQQVYDLVFKPLMEELGDVTHIFISPDGYLSLIPFEVIQQPNGRFLVQDYTFNYLVTGRDILEFDDSLSIKGKVLLMGDPDFNLELNKKKALLSEMHLNEPGEIQLAKRSVNLNEVAFEPLPHARAELEAIGRIMGRDQSRIYTGKQAIEEMLTSGPAPEILHLATHGFFLTDQNAASSGRGWQTVDLPDEKSSQRIQRQINTETLLLRSGILLAGARRSLMTDDMATNDGIVTAEKILGMNLHGTKMVVLSACDTGLGDVWSGEGVFGLRRAFTQAGAQSLVMSLWKVPDKETKELMVRFYENFKSEAMNRCQALRQAILEQMKVVEQRHGYPDPLYWGAFVFMGKP